MQKYTSEKNVLLTIALLKKHGIKKVVVSPGSTNVTFVASIQHDKWFELYSCVDERSAAYMACGLAAESKEPIVINCTGATSSRNYFPALTEAYYRQLPILAITSTQDISKIGNMVCQVIDRSCQPKDTIKYSVHIPTITNYAEEIDCVNKINKAILELNHHGIGPVHINLTTTYSEDYSIDRLPTVRKIQRYLWGEELPELANYKKISIFIGSHLEWTEREIALIDEFCGKVDGVVFKDISSNFTGDFGINYQIALDHIGNDINCESDLLIHIGEMSDYAGTIGNPQEVWRVSSDGEIRDRYGTLTNVFEMTIEQFFSYYTATIKTDTIFNKRIKKCKERVNILRDTLPELPFSQLWVAKKTSQQLPDNSCLHLGILSPLRSWGYWQYKKSISIFCNQGGFGIDGNLSTAIGASLVHPEKLFFVVVGDLSFFYDLNILGNRHIGNNIRILLINNSLAAEFLLTKQHNIRPVNDIRSFISAEGHFSCKSPDLVKDFALNLGFDYIRATSKDEFESVYDRFVNKKISDRPIIFEIFTDVSYEDEALNIIRGIYNQKTSCITKIKQSMASAIGQKRYNSIKKIIKG